MNRLLAQVPETIVDWRHTADVLRDNGLKFAGHLLAAAAIVVIGRWVALWIARIARTLVLRSKVEPTAAAFVSDVVYTVIVAFVIVSALGWVGFDTTSFAAVIAAAGLAIGLALQGSLSNFASGLLLIVFKPFKVGDSVEIGTSAGTVEEVHVFSTVLRTADNVYITVPNSQITQAPVKNYSTLDTRRIELLVGCRYEDDLPAVKQLLAGFVSADSRILPEPKPSVSINDFLENGVQLAISLWVKSADYATVKVELMERIKLGFDQHQFKIVGVKR